MDEGNWRSISLLKSKGVSDTILYDMICDNQ